MKLFALFLCPIILWATCTTGSSGDCEVGSGKTYSTIALCTAAMAAGQTCRVFAGTYNETPTIPNGTSGNYNSLIVNPGDSVVIQGAVMGNHTKLNGFQIQNPSSPNTTICVEVPLNTTDFYITNNHIESCASGIKEDSSSSSTTSNGYIQGNTILYTCSTPASPNVCRAISANGNNQLIENNDISHVSDGPYVFGQHIVLRKNTFHDIHTADCGSNSSNCHVDFMQADGTSGTLGAQFLLVEDNIAATGVNDGGINNCDTPGSCQPSVHAMGIFQGGQCSACNNAIIRFHVAKHIADGGIANDQGAWTFVHQYNNSYIDVNNESGAQANGQDTNDYNTAATNVADLNSIFYYVVVSTMPSFQPVSTAGTSATGAVVGNSLAFCVGTCTLKNHTNSGAWTTDPNNLQSDPLFVNYAGNNFNLTSSSPARNHGTNLTTAVGSGSGSTTLVVADAAYFQDGYGLTGVQPDCIAIGTISNHVCISAGTINYGTNTITLATAATWATSDPIWLYSKSDGAVVLTDTNGPDSGAFPFSPTTVGGSAISGASVVAGSSVQ